MKRFYGGAQGGRINTAPRRKPRLRPLKNCSSCKHGVVLGYLEPCKTCLELEVHKGIRCSGFEREEINKK